MFAADVAVTTPWSSRQIRRRPCETAVLQAPPQEPKTRTTWFQKPIDWRYRFHIYKAYFFSGHVRETPQNMALYGTVPPL